MPWEGAHLTTFLAELGYIERLGGGGCAPLSHREILAWAELSGVEPEPWEVEALRVMSGAFARVANTPDAPCPMQDGATRFTIDMARARALIRHAEAEARGN